jgi:glycosyltransferase involved in cell wall biosynthesis
MKKGVILGSEQKENVVEGFSIIIPAYNEEAGIASVLESMLSVMGRSNIDYELLVVDDGSTDGTAEIVRESGVGLIQHSSNRGYGAALKTGISRASYKAILITDADGTYPNERILDLIRVYKEGSFDMVIGARTSKNVSIPIIRKPAKWIIGKLANYLTRMKIPDLNSGLRVMRKEKLEKFMQILPEGFSFTTTITLAMLTNGCSVKYVPVDYYKRKGKSKIKPIQDTLNFMQLIIRTVLYFNPLNVFVPLSLILVVLAIVVLLGGWFFLGILMDESFGIIIMAAMMVMAIGLLADLIDKRIQ